MTRRRTLVVAVVAAVALALPGAPALAMRSTDGGAVSCFEPRSVGASARSDQGREADHTDVSAREQRAVERRTQQILDRRGISARQVASTDVVVPVYFHVMAAANGSGNVTNSQIRQQVAVLNNTFSGGESPNAADTAFTFTRAGTDRYFDNAWHKDNESKLYRAETRLGGPETLNIWLVGFDYLGIATLPWRYSSRPTVDGIRVHYNSLPGGTSANYSLGETATHEAGHWFGLYHTFQDGCTKTNDEVDDTAAQSSPSTGCPRGRDSCSLEGADPIHNYMDYSFDSCYWRFTTGQSTRMSTMFMTYRTP